MPLINNEIKKITSLKMKKYRDEYGEYIIEGYKIIAEALKHEQQVVMLLVKGMVAQEARTKELMSLAASFSIQIEVIKDKEFDALSTLETPPGVLAVVRKSKEALKADASYIILDSIKDPGNLGAIIRTADWFGIKNIVVGKDSVDIYNPKVIQATMGSLFGVNIISGEDLYPFIETLKAQHYKIIATSLEGQEMTKLPIEKKDKLAVLIGNETTGLNPELLKLADHLYKIPGANTAESLSVSVASGIVLYQLFMLNR